MKGERGCAYGGQFPSPRVACARARAGRARPWCAQRVPALDCSVCVRNRCPLDPTDIPHSRSPWWPHIRPTSHTDSRGDPRWPATHIHMSTLLLFLSTYFSANKFFRVIWPTICRSAQKHACPHSRWKEIIDEKKCDSCKTKGSIEGVGRWGEGRRGEETRKRASSTRESSCGCSCSNPSRPWVRVRQTAWRTTLPPKPHSQTAATAVLTPPVGAPWRCSDGACEALPPASQCKMQLSNTTLH